MWYLLPLLVITAEYNVRLGNYPQVNQMWKVESPYLKPFAIRPDIGSTSDFIRFDSSVGALVARFYLDNSFILSSPYDIRLAPIGGAKIELATVVEFDDFLGDKIRFYSHAYSIGVSAFDLDITSDRNIKFHSDTVPDLVQIIGDAGNLIVKNDIEVGSTYKFSSDSTGDKMYWYSVLYKTYIDTNILGQQSDRYFYWGSDTNTDAMILDGDTGNLFLDGIVTGNGSGLTNLNVSWSDLSGSPQDVITLQEPLYWVNSSTIGIATDYFVKRSGDTMAGTLDMDGNVIQHPRLIRETYNTSSGMSVGEDRFYAP